MASYDRNVVVNCLKRHYELLVRMGYMDASAVELPPAAGWSDAELRVDALRAMGRSETVIDLLRHIPYVHENEEADPVEVYTETFPLRYLRNGRWFGGGNGSGSGDSGEEFANTPLLDLGFAPFDGPVPADMVSLTHADEGTWWLIDTSQGCIYPYGTEFDKREEDVPVDKQWLVVDPVPVQAYFDKIYSQVGNLDVVPAPRSGKWEARVVEEYTEEGQEVKRLYLEHGWPNAFRREEFIQAVERTRASFIEAGLGHDDDDDEDDEMTG
ncbi:hypothetical protein CORC01_12747 [Colletotrichum orchidophilum]|uniref:Uncharacterized protein n=1 Tax=Colletotrichum orchidophilum TaxID=1209926 RepID=A0A1G4AS30_9PEZI|nr:uncharacterized protein CORC01_12747 [Colletotrichum orchidophilum]OHE91959.1 hypothetical protein CORC01_12747 [Colletotrichum orchidophilum]